MSYFNVCGFSSLILFCYFVAAAAKNVHFVICSLWHFHFTKCWVPAARSTSAFNPQSKANQANKIIKTFASRPSSPLPPIIKFWHKAGCHVGLMYYAPKSQNLKWLHNAARIKDAHMWYRTILQNLMVQLVHYDFWNKWKKETKNEYPHAIPGRQPYVLLHKLITN